MSPFLIICCPRPLHRYRVRTNMASSAHKHHLHLPNPYGTAATPPPTPSTQPNLLSTSEAADSLSCLLHRLPPTLTLSLPSRRSSLSSTTVTTVSPLISFSDPTSTLHSNLFSACSQLGFFQLTDHNIPSHLAHSAESESLALFNLSQDEKQHQFPKNWPLGYDAEDDDEESTSACESFCLDSTCSAESTALNLSSLREFTREMEKLGLNVVEALACAFGFENPAREDPTRLCSLMWISEASSSNKPGISGRMYPYVVGLQYQTRCRKYSLLADSGWVSVSPRVDSVLVTVGDIAQVWSNGKLKKVRGRALPNMVDGINSNCISMTLLITLPLESAVSPLLPKLDCCGDMNDVEEGEESSCETTKEERMFNSFSFEDYAWRVYHERLSLKDPLVRYHIEENSDYFLVK